MIQINLIPQVKKDLLHARYVKNRVILVSIVLSIVSISILVLLSVYTYGYQTVASNLLNDKIKDESNKLFAVEDLSKILTIQNQLSSISSLNQNKSINSRFNDMINKINPPAPNSVQYSSIAIDPATKTISIEGQTSGFPAYETFKKTLSSAMVKYRDSTSGEEKEVSLAVDKTISISETSFGIDSSGVQVLRFAISFTYSDEFLSPQSKSAVVVIATSGNVTDSYQGVPQSLFVDKAADVTGGQ